MDLHVEETLWGVPGPEARTAQLQRSANRMTRMKFPDPIWGRVDIRSGARILFVTPPGAGRDDKPLYVDEISNPDDPVLLSIRDVLAAESRPHTTVDRFPRLLTWMNADAVHRLYAGEAVATAQVLSAEETGQAVTALAEAFLREQDEFIKVSFGTWLWDGLFPRAPEASRIVILNATIQAAASPVQRSTPFGPGPPLTDQPRVAAESSREAGAEGHPPAGRAPGCRDGRGRARQVGAHHRCVAAVSK